MDDTSSALQIANETLYKQNFELAIRNQTLSTLRSLYNASLATTNVTAAAQRIASIIATELGFPAVLISVIDPVSNCLIPIAINESPETLQILELVGKPLSEMAVSMDAKDNLAITSLTTNARLITTNILDILNPALDQTTADNIENLFNIKTAIVYPLVLSNRPLGTMIITLSKKVDDLSRAEKETLEQLIDLVALTLDRNMLYNNLEESNTKLIALSKLKDEFVYLASHELRTPLTAIKSYLWLALYNATEPLGEKNKKYTNVAYDSTQRLIHLVNDMLNLSRIESGKVDIKLESVSVSDILNQVKSEFAARQQEKGLGLSVSFPENNLAVKADRDKLLQVLENLVGNSFKFTRVGGQINLVANLSTDQKFVTFDITDTGKGIAEADLPRLFSKFSRLASDSALIKTNETGTGLGLYISKQFVELMGGQISVTSTEGAGSTFTFTVPCA